MDIKEQQCETKKRKKKKKTKKNNNIDNRVMRHIMMFYYITYTTDRSADTFNLLSYRTLSKEYTEESSTGQ